MRSTEDLILDTLMIKLSQATGIPTGFIDVKMPDIEFVNKFDGSQNPATNKPQFPSLGFTYYSDPITKYNNYGNSVVKNTVSGTGIEYQPLGEICLYISIHLFTKTRYDQNQIGNNILLELMTNKYYFFVNDEIAGEYFSVKFKKMRDTDSHQPYHKMFMLECNSRILSQVSGYIINEIDANFTTGQALINGTLSSFKSTPTNVQYLSRKKNNNLIISTFNTMGSLERTVDKTIPNTTTDTIIMYND